jgi:hypothetical protein
MEALRSRTRISKKMSILKIISLKLMKMLLTNHYFKSSTTCKSSTSKYTMGSLWWQHPYWKHIREVTARSWLANFVEILLACFLLGTSGIQIGWWLCKEELNNFERNQVWELVKKKTQEQCHWNQVGLLQQARWTWCGDKEQSKISCSRIHSG